MITYKGVKAAAPLIPLGGAFLIFCGFVYADVYFSSFRVKIVRYLELGEVMILFLNQGYYFICSIGAILLMCFSLSLVISEKIRNDLGRSFFTRNILRYSVVILFFSLSLYIFYYFNPGETELHSVDEICLFRILSRINLSLLLAILCIELLIADKKSAAIQIVCVALGLLSYSAYHGARNASDVVLKNHVAIVKTEKETICSKPDTSYFIGKTNNYLFFYYKIGDSTKVVPVNTVKGMAFKF